MSSLLFSLHKNERTWQIREPRLDNVACGYFEIQEKGNTQTITPVLPRECSVFERKDLFLELIQNFLRHKKIRNYTFQTGTCRSVPYLRYLTPEQVIFEENAMEAKVFPELFMEMHQYADASF